MTPGPEVYGIGAIAIALIGLVWKIWSDSSKRSDKVLDVVEKTAVAQDRLSRNIEENTRVTQQQGELIKKQTDAVLQMVTKVIKNNGKNEQ